MKGLRKLHLTRPGMIGLQTFSTVLILILISTLVSFGQVLKPAAWSYGMTDPKPEVGDEIDLVFKAKIDPNWYLYSSDFDPDLGPMVTEFSFEDNETFQRIGGIRAINPLKAYDEIFEGDYTYFKKFGEFRQTIKILSAQVRLKGSYSYQVCSDIDGKCIPFEDDFSGEDFGLDTAPLSGGLPAQEIQKFKKAGSPFRNSSSSLNRSEAQIVIPQKGEASILKPASWVVQLSQDKYEPGNELFVEFHATIDKNWYLYSSDFDPDLGPMVTQFDFTPHESFKLVGEIEAINPSMAYDEIFEGEYTYFKGTGKFRQRIKVISLPLSIQGNYEYQVCSDIDGKCIPFDEDFALGAVELTSTQNGAGVDGSYGPADYMEGFDRPEDKPLFGFVVFAFLTGLIALLTPCVFPMIPMTVTFFMKDNEGSRGNGLRKAVAFGISIVLIFTVLGMLVAALLGPETLNQWATHWFPNVFIFVVFVVFALSFLGMFEITLPHTWVNKMDAKSEGGGLGGVFFMAATLTLVSFSCTFPIVGSVLVLSTQGQFLKPVLGMFAFSMAFALPFTLFAAFPDWLKSLPKSGGWLNSVKVVLGFLELALGLKFLSVADQAYHWGLLDREIYLSLWIVIFTLIGFYLLGKIRLPHDSKLEAISVPRIGLAIFTFSFVIYLIPGLWGAPLKALAGYLPPITTHDFNLVQLLDDSRSSTSGTSLYGDTYSNLCDDPKYADFLHFPHGLDGFFDYEQALQCARLSNKPLFIDFTGHGCVNCREMEARVWSDPRVLKRLKEDFVVVALYVDDKTVLAESEWYVSTYDGKVKKTLGKQNADFQITRYNNNAQPFYVLLDQEERLLATPKAYDLNPESFVNFLDLARDEYYSRSTVARR